MYLHLSAVRLAKCIFIYQTCKSYILYNHQERTEPNTHCRISQPFSFSEKNPSLPHQSTKRQICSLHIFQSNLHTPQAETAEWKCFFPMLSLQVRALLSSSSLSNHLENFLKEPTRLQSADINSLYFLFFSPFTSQPLPLSISPALIMSFFPLNGKTRHFDRITVNV